MAACFARQFPALSLVALFATIMSVPAVFGGSAIAQNPVPFTDQPLVPDAAVPGGPGFTLTVRGTGFVASSTVNWNGSPLATTFITSSKLTAAILPSDIATASSAAVTVVNPGPGGGVSNTQYFSIAVAGTPVSFAPAVQYSAGSFATEFVAVADVNRDGIPDVIVAIQNCPGPPPCSSDGQVAVMLGNGDGTFQPAVLYDSGGKSAWCVAVADMNGDGKPDIVVKNSDNSYGSSVGVLLGNGDGTFQPAIVSSTGGIYLAVADLNGDGKLDVVTSDGGFVNVLLGNGDGTFQPGVLYGAYAYFVAVADVNGDGVPDLIAAGSMQDGDTGIGALSVLLGNGDGTFLPAVNYASGATLGYGATSVAVADVNADGKPDMVAANYGDSTVGVLLGNGNGTFQPAVLYPTGGGAWSVTIADLNGDGEQDIIVGDGGKIGVLTGRGDGTFRPVLKFAGGGDTLNMVAADVNGDGRADLLTPDGGLDVSVWLNSSAPPPCVGKCATSTAVTSNLNPSAYGQAVTFTAAVTSNNGAPPNGETVTFEQGLTVLGTGTLSSGSASFATSSLKVGNNEIKAVYAGDSYFGSSSKARTQVVSKASTTTTLVSSQNPSSYEQSVTFTATVTPQFGGMTTGSVKFYDGATTLGTRKLVEGVASYTTTKLAVGTHPVTAEYEGDANSGKSTSPVLDQVVQ